MPRPISPHSVETQIARRIGRNAEGTVFTPAAFAALGPRASIDKALQHLAKQGTLRRLSRGLYDKPRHDPMLGLLWPSLEAILEALAGKDKLRTLPAGAYAANLLGLSEQVPAKKILLTDGGSRSIKAGPLQITLKHTSPRTMASAGRLSGLIIQACKGLGAQHMTAERIAHLRKTLPAAERAKLLEDVPLAPAWIQNILRTLAADAPNPAKTTVKTSAKKAKP